MDVWLALGLSCHWFLEKRVLDGKERGP